MADLKITIEQLKNYLGTGLEVQVGTSGKRQLTALQDNSKYAFITAWSGSREKQMIGIEHLKPICYKLSDLDKFIHELGFVPIEEIDELFGESETAYTIHTESGFLIETGVKGEIIYPNPNCIPFYIIQKLFQWHFWPFGDEYFDEGLVIDKMKGNGE